MRGYVQFESTSEPPVLDYAPATMFFAAAVNLESYPRLIGIGFIGFYSRRGNPDAFASLPDCHVAPLLAMAGGQIETIP